MATDMTVANTIWRQISLGTKMACGAREQMGDADSLTFRVTISRGVTHKVKVQYNKGADDYTVILYRIRGTNVTEQEKHKGVYCDNLSDVIYRMCNK
jgi:hypothetical protein